MRYKHRSNAFLHKTCEISDFFLNNQLVTFLEEDVIKTKKIINKKQYYSECIRDQK